MDNTTKLYSQRAISIATFFGSPLAAAYLIKKNYEALNEDEKARKAFLVGIFSTMALFALIFSIPEAIIDRIPNMVIPAIYTGIIYSWVERYQGKAIKEHLEKGGEFHSGWKATGVGLICLVVIIIGILFSAYLSGDLDTLSDADAKLYETEITNFSEKESTALSYLNSENYNSQEELVGDLEKGILLWKENKNTLNKLNGLENIDQELLDQNKQLSYYCDLRIEQYNLLIKSIRENTDIYDLKIEEINSELLKTIE